MIGYLQQGPETPYVLLRLFPEDGSRQQAVAHRADCVDAERTYLAAYPRTAYYWTAWPAPHPHAAWHDCLDDYKEEEMTVELKATRKVVVIGWDEEQVKGTHASLQVAGEEKRNVTNDGRANLYFPAAYTGSLEVTVQGSRSGEDTGTITVK
jgi:hypothetical protein